MIRTSILSSRRFIRERVAGELEMRLLLISEFPDSPTAPTAAGIRIGAFRDFFMAQAWRVLLVVPTQNGGSRPTLAMAGVKRLATYETRRQGLHSPVAALFLPADLHAYLKCFREFMPNVALISGYSPFILLVPLIVAKILRIPVVYDVLDSWILLSAFHPGRLRNWLRRRAECYALSHGDVVLGVTQSQVELLEQIYHIESSRTMTVPHGADPKEPLAPLEVPAYDLIHVGPPRDYYDNEALLDAIARLAGFRPNLRMAYLGIEEGGAKSRLREDLERKGISSNVDLIPPVPRSEVIKWTRKARAGLVSLTSHEAYRAAISTKSFDYVAAGIPILYLGPRDSEQGQFIRRFKIGRVFETPAELAEQCGELLSDDKALREFRENARSAVMSLAWKNILAPLRARLRALALQSLQETSDVGG